jgi:hypothetical protein
MGQKVNPHGLRVGVIKDWDSQWFVDKKDFAANIKEDNEIRKVLKKKYYQAAISKIAIEKGIPYELADRLVGDNEDEITKDAETVASYLGAKSVPPAFSHDNKSSGSTGNLDGAYMALLGDLTK